MKFIKLTYADDMVTFVNVQFIIAFERPTDANLTQVVFQGAVEFTEVKETPMEILNRINRADTI